MKIEKIVCDQCGKELRVADRHWVLTNGAAAPHDLCNRVCLAEYAAWMGRPAGVDPNFHETHLAAERARRR